LGPFHKCNERTANCCTKARTSIQLLHFVLAFPSCKEAKKGQLVVGVFVFVRDQIDERSASSNKLLVDLQKNDRDFLLKKTLVPYL